MNIFILIIVAVVGIALGAYFTSRKSVGGLISEQSKKKAENKEKVFAYVQKNRKVKNRDVEKMLGVSDATAERYLDELEKEGKIEQHGKTGNAVYYVLRKGL